jgi:hypothetical protein
VTVRHRRLASPHRHAALPGAGAARRRAGAGVGWRAAGRCAGRRAPADAVRPAVVVGRRARRGDATILCDICGCNCSGRFQMRLRIERG